MDETDKLLSGSIKSLNSDQQSIVSANNEFPILSPKSSFYKQFHRVLNKDTMQESPTTDQASAATAPKWAFPIDFDLWGTSVASGAGSGRNGLYDLKRFLLYSERTGILESSTFEGLELNTDPGHLLEETTFWLDVTLPTPNEMNLLGRVSFIIYIRYLVFIL